jgi:hypothetical protein
MDEEEGKLSLNGRATTSSISLTSAVGHPDDSVKRIANTNIDNDETDDDNLKEEGFSTTETDCANDDSIQSQPHETTFPQHLMDLIETETTDDNAATVHGQKAIEWLSTGDRFIIRDRLILESYVLTKYFNNKCKFMSFIRKLYRFVPQESFMTCPHNMPQSQLLTAFLVPSSFLPHAILCRWGFRQVEKDFSSGTMIFMHKHFTRGDKKKCLAMRSTVNVKKPSAASMVAMNASSNRWLGYRDVGAVPHAGDVMAESLFQSNSQAIYGSDASVLSNVGYEGAIYNMLGGRANPGLSMSYGLGMQMQMPQYNNLHNGLDWVIPGNNRFVEAQRSPGAAAAVLHSIQGYGAAVTVRQPNAGISDIGGLPPDAAEEVNLASLIMNEDPTIDAWQALQLAKMRLNGTCNTSYQRRAN